MMCLILCLVEMIEQSKKDALLAEALADLGKIDELVRLLPNNLIKSTEALEDAGQKFRDSVDYYVSKMASTTESNVDAYLSELALQNSQALRLLKIAIATNVILASAVIACCILFLIYN